MTSTLYLNWQQQNQARRAMQHRRPGYRRVILPSGKQMEIRRDRYIIEISTWTKTSPPEDTPPQADDPRQWWRVKTRRRRVPNHYERPPQQLTLF